MFDVLYNIGHDVPYDIEKIVPCGPDAGRHKRKFLYKCGRRFRAVRHRMLCPGVQALIANILCVPVPESERRVPPQVTYNWQTSGAQHPLPDTPDMAGPDIICPDNCTLSVRFTLPETIRDILRRAMTHTTFEDFVLGTAHEKKFLFGSFRHRTLNRP